MTPLDRGLRRLVPRGLLGRSLLIILVPLLLLQAIALQVFYGSHLDVISRRLWRARNQEQQMPRRMARRKMRRDAGQHFLPIIHQLHGRPAAERFHRVFRHSSFAPTHTKRPGQFLAPDMNPRIAEHGPIHHMIMMQIC